MNTAKPVTSQELMSYITDSKIYTPRRVPQGSCDAAVHFQQTMENCFAPLLYDFLVIWIDDLLLFADNIDTYIAKLEELLDLVANTYILVLKDHATHYCELVVCDTADSAVVTTAILEWHSRFGVPPVWVSDNGSHFKNEVVTELSRRLKTHQIFAVAYSPWINGSVERVNRDILQVLRAVIMEYKISAKDWVYLVPLVQSRLNHTAVPSLGNKAPTELFTGLPCPSPLAEFYDASKKKMVRLPATSAAISKNYPGHLRAQKHRWNSSINDYEILVSWKGLESAEDSWEPLNSLAKVVKVLLDQYIQQQDTKVRKYWTDYQSKVQ
ncbi:unnamed protein product [Phytophthora fragariaefolia]|uniref:Unnamed protein product n=1 Tax=Phytophthora fragariaefolia TaxID=1490495 RepID=A0A9W7D1A9_9STRA|nr:unnamed protein product [Phytophthora fragariaefolia]